VDEPFPGYAPTVEQDELRRSLRKFLASTASESAVRAVVDSPEGFDRASWLRLGSELGALGLAVAEDLGGAGAGLVEQAIACEEFGRCLLPGPVFGTVGLAIPLLAALGDDQILPSVISGESTACVALPHGGIEFDHESIRVTESNGLLTGAIAQVVDGDADVVVVAARNTEGFGLFVVDGAEREKLHTLDQTRRQVRMRFDGVHGKLLAAGADAQRAIERTLCVGAALLAAEQVGGAQTLLEVCVEYASTRWQFGRHIGSFQAIKHRCADMLVLVEHARSAAYHAAGALQTGADDPRLVSSLAKALCSDAFQYVANSAIQIHGGIGFTWEHPAHLYLKRAVTDAALLGSADAHLDRIASIVIDRDRKVA
jgi:alkylation response protein AidB-like acyl-CoA dehydrogenase